MKCTDCENLVHCVTTPRMIISHQLNFCNNTENEYCSAKEGGCSTDPASCKIFGLKEFDCRVSSLKRKYSILCNKCRKQNISIGCKSYHTIQPSIFFLKIQNVCLARQQCISTKLNYFFGFSPFQNSSSFPDPYDCNSYHQCIEQADGSFSSMRYLCSEDRAYDPLTGTCRFKPNHRVCRESPVPKCLYPLQMGALKENPSIYYVCQKTIADFVPLLFKCRTGEEYKATANACVETQDTHIFSCSEEGTFIDPNDNSKYYRCQTDKTYILESCQQGEYFNIGKKSCQKVSRFL